LGDVAKKLRKIPLGQSAIGYIIKSIKNDSKKEKITG
jgi:hypothetical protein